MDYESPFKEWFSLVQPKLEQAGLALPEDIELMELSHMECKAEKKSINDFIKEYPR